MSQGNLGDGDLRASDADRERVVSRLREHAAEGRLTMDEFEDRMRQAYEARTYGELATLTRDLPVDLGAPTSGYVDLGEKTPDRRSFARRSHVRSWSSIATLVLVWWVGLHIIAGIHASWPLWIIVGAALVLFARARNHSHRYRREELRARRFAEREALARQRAAERDAANASRQERVLRVHDQVMEHAAWLEERLARRQNRWRSR
jgi:hypothetical protein